MNTADTDFAQQVQVARAAQICRRSRWSVILYLLILIPLGFGTSFAADHPYVFGLMVTLFALAGVLRWRALLVGPPSTDPDQAGRWLRSFGRHTALSALIWGCFAFYMQIQYRGQFLQFTIVLVSAGIGSYAVGAFAGDRKLTLTYLACALIPTLAGIAAGADNEALVIFAMMSIFLTAVTFQVIEVNDWFVRSTIESLLHEKSRQEAEAAARVKSEFLANMSHELRTPMNGVMGMLELLLKSPLDRDQKLLARTSHRSAEVLLDILNDILDFSKMSAGKLVFARRDFILRNTIEDVFDLLGPRATEKGLDVGYQIDSAVPEWVCGDEGRLRQVLMNLVSNAIKFSGRGDWPHGGSVFVDVRSLKQEEKSVRLLFSVTDQGMGMGPATLAKLFKPFMQADTSTSRRYGGTGLGLAISSQLVTAMGGTITAESEEQAGAKFTFDIELETPANPHTITPLATSACKVLVVEPAPLSRATIGYLFSRHGASCTLAGTLAEAKEHIAAENFQFVVAGALDGKSPAAIRSELQASLTGSAAAFFLLLHHSGESVNETGTLTRPVRASQIAEAMVSASCLPRSVAPAPVRLPSRLSGHVLIAEDNAVNQLLAQRLVLALGLTAKVVPDGQAAVEAAASQQFQLVLMDCQMPGMDGYEATRRLRETPETAEIPVIAMTANAMKGDRELCLAAGMDDYVSKPIRLDRLREVLSHYLPAASPVPQIESTK